jgi:2-oxoisovalerate dehydrogenase E1 component beta subunit
VPIGQSKTVRPGKDAVVFTYSRLVHVAKQVADKLSQEGLGEVEVVDLRTIYPYDWKAISEATVRTGRVLFLNEDTEITNFGEHLLRRVVEEHFYQLRARPRVLAGAHVPGVGLAPPLEDASIPTEITVERELRALLSEET